MKTKLTLLLHPLFLISLAILLLNDFYFKYEFHNWLTGKLSDFTGLFVFGIFFIAFFPAYKKQVLLATALLFTWWKSPFSDAFIFFLNHYLSIPATRVVDHSDLIALLVLPFTLKIELPTHNPSFLRKTVISCIGLISLFAFCATSLPRQIIYYPYRENEVRWNETFSTKLSEASVLDRLNTGGLNYQKDSVRFYKVTETEDFYYRTRNNTDSSIQWIPVTNNSDSSLYVRKISRAFYTIPEYVLEEDTLLNLEISIYTVNRKKKRTEVKVESFRVRQPGKNSDFNYEKLLRKYKIHFKRLFKE